MKKEIEPVMNKSIIKDNIDTFALTITNYLDDNGLPSKNILVSVDERGKVLNNLPDIIAKLDIKLRNKAMYLSKFMASSTVGLFDAALNYLWDELVQNLREKIVTFDLDYFYDSIITDPERREKFKSEDQLREIPDNVLLEGSCKIGLISDIGYKHLDYIRDMRNFASAAHPNQNELTGFQLISWLETCIKEVLAKGPEISVTKTRRLLKSIREENITDMDSKPIIDSIYRIPDKSVHLILRTVFGMYCDENLSRRIRRNINHLAQAIWDRTDEEMKYEIGKKYAIYSANAQIGKKNLAREFLEQLDALNYLTEDVLSNEIESTLDILLTTHYGRNNFYNEYHHAKQLQKYIPETGLIPVSVRFKLVKIVIICRLGNHIGVARSAIEFYDKIIDFFGDYEIIEFIRILNEVEISNAIQSIQRLMIYKEIAQKLVENTSNMLLQDTLKIIATKFSTNWNASTILNKIKNL